MLIRAERLIYSVPNKKRFSYMLYTPLRTFMLKLKIDPASLRFWHRKGTQIKIWRKRHGLKEVVSDNNSTPVQKESIVIQKTPSVN
jgi:hypothetical protein